MAATNYTALIAAIRRKAGDTAGTSIAAASLSNLVPNETPQGDQDGVNVNFYLANPNVIVGVVGGFDYGPYLTLGTTIRAKTGFAITPQSGLVVFGAAPGAGVAPFGMNYWFQWMTDADYSNLVDDATEELGSLAGVDVGTQLYPPLIQYALAGFWTKRASDYANKYATASGGASEQAQSVTANFLNLAKNARKLGDGMRLNAYVDPGAKKQAASGTITYGFSKGTPRR